MEKINTSRGIVEINIPVNPKLTGDEYYMICPLCAASRQPAHRNEKKLAINLNSSSPKYRLWRCNHCGEGGALLSDKKPYQTKARPVIKNINELQISDALVKWFWEKRKISIQTLEALSIIMTVEPVYQKKNKDKSKTGKVISRKCISYKYLREGTLVNIKYRDPDKNFKMITGASKILYNIDAIKGKKEAIITEGENDTAAYHEAGCKNVVSVPHGVTISKDEREYYEKTGTLVVKNQINLEYIDLCIKDLEDKDIIYIATDDDAAGIKLREELVRRLGKDKCRFIRFGLWKKPDGTPCNDPNDVLVHHGKETLKSTLDFAESYPIEDAITIDDVWDKINYNFDHGNKKGLSLGFRSLDPHFTLRLGHPVALNGYYNTGKTTFAFSAIALYSMVKYGWKWGMYSPENYPVEDAFDIMIEAFVGNTTDIDHDDRMNKKDLEKAREFLAKHVYFVDREEAYSPKDLRDICHRMIQVYGIRGFLTDPWNSLDHTKERKSFQNIEEYLRQELSAEVRFATRNGIFKLINVHPPTPVKNPDKKYKTPSAFDLEGGSIWSKKMYEMICLDMADSESWSDTKVEVHIQKVKSHKLVGIPTDRNNPVILSFDRRTGRYSETDDQGEEHCPFDNNECNFEQLIIEEF